MVKIVRLIFSHPEDLRRGKTGKSDICSVFRKFILSYSIIQILNLLSSTSVIPQNCRADDIVIFIQSNQTVHLTTETDSLHLALVALCSKFFQTCYALLKPVLRLLLRPAGMRKIQWVLLRYNLMDLPVLIHQQKLNCGCSEIDTDKKHCPVLLFRRSQT